MRFSLKIFITTISTLVVMFSLGGYIMISSLFNSALERELETAGKEHRLLSFSVETAVSTMGFDVETENSVNENILKIVKVLEGDGNANGVKIRLREEDGTPIYEVSSLQAESDLLSYVTEEKDGYTILKSEERYYIQYASLINITTKNISMESFKDITYIFTNRTFQYDTYKKLMMGMVVIDGVLMIGISSWLTRPIKKLSRATRKIAQGDYAERAIIRNKDEIGRLATDFNSMADNLERKISDLEEAARRQEDFIASFAHELKTPMTSVIGYADMLRSKELSKERNFMAANYIFNEGKRLEALSLKLLDLIVIQNKEFEKQPIDSKQLLQDSAAFLRPELEIMNIALEVDAESVSLHAEPDLLKTLIMNLLDNARKAISGKGIIKLNGVMEETLYKISITDTGRGIPAEEIDRITEAFYMVDKSRSREKGGAGLGLSICMKIVELHEGKMEISSVYSEGTTVDIYLNPTKQEEAGD